MTIAAKTHAIVVGIEAYGLGEDWDLTGPASDALDCVEWLQQKGVPTDHINLLITPTADREAEIVTRAQGLGFTADSMQHCSRNNLQDAFDNIETTDGDFLVVFWGGHGFVDILKHRFLICADATEQNLKNINIDLAQIRLSCDVTDAFARQLFVVDACGDYYDSLGEGFAVQTGGVPTGLVQRLDVKQATLFSCQNGMSAGQNQAEGYGEFSRLVLTELKKPATTLPPDMESIHQKVSDDFESASQGDGGVQRPVLRILENYDENRQNILRRGHGSDQSKRPAITLLQQSRLLALIVGYEGLQKPEQRAGFIASVLPGVNVTRSPEIDEDLGHCINEIVGCGGFPAMCDWFEQDATGVSESRVLLSIEIRSFVSNIIQANQIREHLDNLALRAPAISTAFLKTSKSQDRRTTPTDLAHALELLLYQQRSPAEFLIAKFVLRLERECPGDAKVTSTLLDLLGVDAAKATEIRKHFATESAPMPRLIVDFYGDRMDDDRGWPCSLRAWLQRDDGTWSPFHEQPCENTTDGVKKAFNSVVLWALGATDNQLAIEIVVPRCLFDNDFDLWKIKEDVYDIPSAVGKEHALVLRWGERYWMDGLKRNWRRKCQLVNDTLETTEADIHWVPDVDMTSAADIESMSDSVRTSSGTHCVGFEFTLPDAPANLTYDPVVAALRTGAAYALWFRNSSDDTCALKADTHAQLLRSGVKDFPSGLMTLRAQPEAHEEELSKQLVALWDDAFDIPSTSNVREPK